MEVKYQSVLNIDRVMEHASKLCERWEYPWLFVATPTGFYCGMCKWILEKKSISPLSDEWASAQIRDEYLQLLNEFRR